MFSGDPEMLRSLKVFGSPQAFNPLFFEGFRCKVAFHTLSKLDYFRASTNQLRSSENRCRMTLATSHRGVLGRSAFDRTDRRDGVGDHQQFAHETTRSAKESLPMPAKQW